MDRYWWNFPASSETSDRVMYRNLWHACLDSSTSSVPSWGSTTKMVLDMARKYWEQEEYLIVQWHVPKHILSIQNIHSLSGLIKIQQESNCLNRFTYHKFPVHIVAIYKSDYSTWKFTCKSTTVLQVVRKPWKKCLCRCTVKSVVAVLLTFLRLCRTICSLFLCKIIPVM